MSLYGVIYAIVAIFNSPALPAVMFGAVGAAGIRVIATSDIDRREMIIKEYGQERGKTDDPGIY
jgi:xanthine/uracil permease